MAVPSHVHGHAVIYSYSMDRIKLIIDIACEVLVAIAAIWGLRQLALLKADTALRAERASKEKALEANMRYCEQVNQAGTHLYVAMTKSNTFLYDGPIGDFRFSSLSEQAQAGVRAKDKSCGYQILAVLNELEIVAIMLTSGVGDEQVAYHLLALAYCDSVEKLYDFLCYKRGDTTPTYFQPICDLYMLWKPRLLKQELQHQNEILEGRMAAIDDKVIPPLGLGSLPKQRQRSRKKAKRSHP